MAPNQAEFTVEHAARGAFTAALSQDGRYSLVSSVEHGVSLWDNDSHGLKYQWHQSSEHENLVHSLAIAYDNSFAVTAENNTFCHLEYKKWQKPRFLSNKNRHYSRHCNQQPGPLHTLWSQR